MESRFAVFLVISGVVIIILESTKKKEIKLEPIQEPKQEQTKIPEKPTYTDNIKTYAQYIAGHNILQYISKKRNVF